MRAELTTPRLRASTSPPARWACRSATSRRTPRTGRSSDRWTGPEYLEYLRCRRRARRPARRASTRARSTRSRRGVAGEQRRDRDRPRPRRRLRRVQRVHARGGTAARASGRRSPRATSTMPSSAGCSTASLQSTAMAERVYAAVGFRDLGRILEYVPAVSSSMSVAGGMLKFWLKTLLRVVARLQPPQPDEGLAGVCVVQSLGALVGVEADVEPVEVRRHVGVPPAVEALDADADGIGDEVLRAMRERRRLRIDVVDRSAERADLHHRRVAGREELHEALRRLRGDVVEQSGAEGRHPAADVHPTVRRHDRGASGTSCACWSSTGPMSRSGVSASAAAAVSSPASTE